MSFVANELIPAIWKLRDLEINWNSQDSQPPNSISLLNACWVADAMRDTDLLPDRIVASADDGVALTFRHGSKYANVECLNGGEIWSMIVDYDDDKNPETQQIEIDIESLRTKLIWIKEFLG